MAYLLTVADYYMGRDGLYILSEEQKNNAYETVKRVNTLLVVLEQNGIALEINPATKTYLTSGWRPAEYNAKVQGAALRSKHISCQAADLFDPEGEIDSFLMDNTNTVLKDTGLFMEHPSATKGWCHVQTVPPRSGRLIFYP